MANLLWGKVYFQDNFAGFIRQEPGERYTFTYDEHYLAANFSPISYTLPLTSKPYISENQLPAFFDNLVAEGWLELAQARLLGKRNLSRFDLLLNFGLDCAGAVSVVDPEPLALVNNKLTDSDKKTVAFYRNRASLSGIQPKVLLIKDKQKYRPAVIGELSTHIAKLPSENINDITYNEWFTLNACKAFMPDDELVEASLTYIDDLDSEVLLIKRFDRDPSGNRIHFEEFNQLLNLQTKQKYNGAYKDMADFIYQEKSCLPTEVFRLFKRILVGLLLGNTDMHFKNFAMLHTNHGLRLAPNYDQVAAAIYKPYQYVALEFDGAPDRIIGRLKPKNIIALGREFALKDEVIMMAVNEINQRLPAAKDAVSEACDKSLQMQDKIIDFMEKRWRGTFDLIGKRLLQKR